MKSYIRQIDWDFDEEMSAYILYVDYNYIGPMFTNMFIRSLNHVGDRVIDKEELIKDLIHVTTIPLQLTKDERQEAYDKISKVLT